MNSFLVIAVDCFVLISGYFGIKAKWKGFIHLYVLCAFYSVFLTLFSFYETGQFSIKEFLFSFLVFSNSKWWFIQCYVYLFILSPILNIVIDSISKNRKVFIALLLIGSILTFYFGYLWKGSINQDGYNVMNFIFLYFIGRFVALYIGFIKIRFSIALYLMNVAVISLIGISILLMNINVKWVSLLCFPYNSPFVISAAIAFFLLFRSLTFKNCYVNWMASSALSIYLIHEHNYISCKLYNYINSLSNMADSNYILFINLFGLDYYGGLYFNR